MRDVKFRYRFKERKEDKIRTAFLTLDQIENQNFKPHIFDFGKYEILSRDQYTGLKDKNGKEIYEGDRLRSKNRLETKTGVIIFERGTYMMDFPNDGVWNKMLFACRMDMDSWENIGHIYKDKK